MIPARRNMRRRSPGNKNHATTQGIQQAMQKMSKSGTALCAKNPSFSSLLAELSKRAEAVKSGMGMVTAPLSTMSPSSGSTINQPPTSPEAQMMGAAPPTGPQAGNPAGAASCRERRKPCCFSSGWRRRNQCRQLAGPLCVPGSRRGEFPSAADRTSVAGARAAGGSVHSNDADANRTEPPLWIWGRCRRRGGRSCGGRSRGVQPATR
jgi:hypothetical protein